MITPAPRPVTAAEYRLEALERDVVKGQHALEERNHLVVMMTRKGYTQADLTRRLNRQRVIGGAAPLTPDALFMILKRAKEKKQ